jgi:hypothetical protein
MTRAQNILITGIPRSGTTLITATLHEIPNCVALGEPEDLKHLHQRSASPEDYARKVEQYLAATRGKILAGEPVALNFEKDALRVASNYFKRTAAARGYHAEKTYERREAVIPVQNEAFTLCLKNNAQFASCLESLAALREAVVVAVVREPWACLFSWRSLNMPVSSGKLPAGERFSRELRKIGKLEDVLLAQVKILDWFFAAFYRLRERIRLLRYEDFVARPELLRELLPAPAEHVFPVFQSMNRRPEYALHEEERVRDYLRRHTEFVKYFYPV